MTEPPGLPFSQISRVSGGSLAGCLLWILPSCRVPSIACCNGVIERPAALHSWHENLPQWEDPQRAFRLKPGLVPAPGLCPHSSLLQITTTPSLGCCPYFPPSWGPSLHYHHSDRCSLPPGHPQHPPHLLPLLLLPLTELLRLRSSSRRARASWMWELPTFSISGGR